MDFSSSFLPLSSEFSVIGTKVMCYWLSCKQSNESSLPFRQLFTHCCHWGYLYLWEFQTDKNVLVEYPVFVLNLNVFYNSDAVINIIVVGHCPSSYVTQGSRIAVSRGSIWVRNFLSCYLMTEVASFRNESLFIILMVQEICKVTKSENLFTYLHTYAICPKRIQWHFHCHPPKYYI